MNEEGMSTDEVLFWYGQKKSPMWRCEERLKPLCDKYHSLFPEQTPAEGNRSSWYAGLRRILREFGEYLALEFIEFAHEDLKTRPPLDIVDAHSIGFLIPKFKKDRRAHDPRRYLIGTDYEGVTDDD